MVSGYMDNAIIFSKNDCSIFHLNILPTVNTGFSKFDNLAYVFFQRKEVHRHLKHHNYDIIHIHTSREFLFLKDVFLAKMIKVRYEIPIVITIHVGSINTVFNRISFLKERVFNILNNYVDRVIFLSEQMRLDFINRGLQREKSAVLYNFHQIPSDSIQIEETSNPLRLLFVGAIHKEKGILELLTAVSQLPESFQFHLDVCGLITDNAIIHQIEAFKNCLGSKICFKGYVSGLDKINEYKYADVLLLPSYHEGLPLVIMEALGAGCAIVATRVGAIPEVLSDENCIWVDVGSSDDIKKAIEYFNSDTLSMMKHSNFKKGFDFTIDVHIKKLSEIYHNVIG